METRIPVTRVPSSDGGVYTLPIEYLGKMMDALKSVALENEEPLETINRLCEAEWKLKDLEK